MLPAPSDALPLPPNPDIAELRRLAPSPLSYGFATWPKLARHVEALARPTRIARFESAVDAIVTGNLAALRHLLASDPPLVRTRSTRVHGATLLIYTAANGVENYRQKTPPNIVTIAHLLLASGAHVDAAAKLYGAASTTLELAATSIHPLRAGVQPALLRTLLDHGASLKNPSLLAACLANGRPQAAEFLAARGAPIDLPAAAGLGHLAAVEQLYPAATAIQKRDALFWACEYGRDDVVEFLLAHHPDLAVHRADGQTPLHWAVIGGRISTVRLLLRDRPPLEAVNSYGGTPLGQALWSAAHGGEAAVYLAILDALASAGARLPERLTSINPPIDSWLAVRGVVIVPASPSA